MAEKESNLFHLKKLTEALSTSGEETLNEAKLKALKNICKQSDEYVAELYKFVLKWLSKKHSEIRLGAFKICDAIFYKSHCFRELVLKNFNKITELTLGLKRNKPLPKPDNAAKKLRELTIKSIYGWYRKYNEGYPKLCLGYKFLKSKNVDFEYNRIWTAADRRRQEEELRKEEELRERKTHKVTEEIQQNSDKIYDTLKHFKNCFKLLIPDLSEFFIPLENDENDSGLDLDLSSSEIDSEEYGSHFMRSHGLIKETSVTVDLNEIHNIKETSDNEVVISTLKEQINVFKKLLVKIKEWEAMVLPYSSTHSALIKKIVDFKSSIDECVRRYDSLKFVPQKTNLKSSQSTFESDSDDDDDFIEVPLYDPRVVQSLSSEASLLGINPKKPIEVSAYDRSEAGPSGIQNTTADLLLQANNKSKKRNIESFLEEKWEPPVKCHNNTAGLSQVWIGTTNLHLEDEKQPDVFGISTRAVDYISEFQPVKWECRAPMRSGRLCPRRDRQKCPLHGPVIPRDELGIPIKLEDAARELKRQEDHNRQFPDWQDPTLLADIQASTGVNLDIKKAKKRKRKYENLTDLKSLENSPRKRLAKKVLSKRAFSRLNKSLARLPP